MYRERGAIVSGSGAGATSTSVSVGGVIAITAVASVVVAMLLVMLYVFLDRRMVVAIKARRGRPADSKEKTFIGPEKANKPSAKEKKANASFKNEKKSQTPLPPSPEVTDSRQSTVQNLAAAFTSLATKSNENTPLKKSDEGSEAALAASRIKASNLAATEKAVRELAQQNLDGALASARASQSQPSTLEPPVSALEPSVLDSSKIIAPPLPEVATPSGKALEEVKKTGSHRASPAPPVSKSLEEVKKTGSQRPSPAPPVSKALEEVKKTGSQRPSPAPPSDFPRSKSLNSSLTSPAPPLDFDKRQSAPPSLTETTTKGAEPKSSVVSINPFAVKRRDFIVNTIDAQMLGALPCTADKGQEVITEAYKAIVAANIKDQPLVQIIIFSEGVDIILAKEEGAAETILKAYKLSEIAFLSAVADKPKIVGLVIQDSNTKSNSCHLFECRSKAREVVDAVKEGFKIAQEIKTDPFGVARVFPETPEVMKPAFEKYVKNRGSMVAKSIIGHGQYGKVYLADFKSETGEEVPLAVKLMKPGGLPADELDFLLEAESMAQFDHPSLLRLFGVCIERRPWCILVDFMPYKDLGVILRQAAKNEIYVRNNEMLHMITQIIEGMLHMLSKRYLHRDLAVRNILLTENNIIKVADFGLARRIPDGQDFWRLDKAGRLPVKYMAPETLTVKRFTEKSEVWAFGVCVWEIMSYGLGPWDAMGIDSPDVKKAIMDGKRLLKPIHLYPDNPLEAIENNQEASQVVWDKMFATLQTTWKHEQPDRPSFADLKVTFGQYFKEESARLPDTRDLGLRVFQSLAS